MADMSQIPDQLQSREIVTSKHPTPELVPAKPREIVVLGARKNRRHKSWILLLTLLLIVIAGYLVRKYFASRSVATFETAKVERGPIQAFVTATGNLNPVVNVQVGSQVSGNIKALYADFNTRVHKGQLIAQIDSRLKSMPHPPPSVKVKHP